MEKMRAEVEQAKAKQQIAENMRRDFEKDRDKMKKVNLDFEKINHFLWFTQEIQLEFEHEKEVRKAAADKQQRELEKKVELSKSWTKNWKISFQHIWYMYFKMMMDPD